MSWYKNIIYFNKGGHVVVEELIPESSIGDHSDIGTIGFAIGFVIMMILDVALS